MAEQNKERQQNYSAEFPSNVIVHFDNQVRGRHEWNFSATNVMQLMITLKAFAPNYELSEPMIDGAIVSPSRRLYEKETVNINATRKADEWP